MDVRDVRALRASDVAWSKRLTPGRGSGERRRLREERSRRAVAAAVAVAREKGIRVDEPCVLADLFSLMVHLRPAPLVARVATRMPKLWTPIEDWLAREIAVTEYPSDRGAPVVAPSRELSPGPHERDGYWISFWTYVLPDPERIPIGVIFFVPSLGVGTGALGSPLADVGIDDDFIRQVREMVTEGTSALFALTSGVTALDEVVDELKHYDFEIISTSLPEEQEQQLRETFAQE